jgi:hypothetical protein
MKKALLSKDPEQIDEIINSFSLSRLAGIKSLTKELARIFISQTFHAVTEENPDAHFILRIDCILFGLGSTDVRKGISKLIHSLKVTAFGDKKQTTMQTFEWSAANYPEGLSADNIEIRIPADKNTLCKIELGFNESMLAPKFAISNALKEMFRLKINELSKEEICTCLLAYISTNNLSYDRDKRNFKCNEEMKLLLNIPANQFPTTSNNSNNNNNTPSLPSSYQEMGRIGDLWNKLCHLEHIRPLSRSEFDMQLYIQYTQDYIDSQLGGSNNSGNGASGSSGTSGNGNNSASNNSSSNMGNGLSNNNNNTSNSLYTINRLAAVGIRILDLELRAQSSIQYRERLVYEFNQMTSRRIGEHRRHLQQIFSAQQWIQREYSENQQFLEKLSFIGKRYGYIDDDNNNNNSAVASASVPSHSNNNNHHMITNTSTTTANITAAGKKNTNDSIDQSPQKRSRLSSSSSIASTSSLPLPLSLPLPSSSQSSTEILQKLRPPIPTE